MKAIALCDKNLALASDNKQPLFLKNDLSFFKKMTTGNIVIYGRKTHEQLPGEYLKDRVNLVLSKNPEYRNKNQNVPYVFFIDSKEAAEAVCNLKSDNLEVFVIGGTSIFELFSDIIDTVYITRMRDHTFSHPTHYLPFDILDNTRWNCKPISSYVDIDLYTHSTHFVDRYCFTKRK